LGTPQWFFEMWELFLPHPVVSKLHQWSHKDCGLKIYVWFLQEEWWFATEPSQNAGMPQDHKLSWQTNSAQPWKHLRQLRKYTRTLGIDSIKERDYLKDLDTDLRRK
jgi:hypothetical protein